MSDYFEAPAKPGITMLHIHEHEWKEVGASQNPNGTWSSVWACNLCPDIGVGGPVGPIPPGFCQRCQWVNEDPAKTKCDECGVEKVVA